MKLHEYHARSLESTLSRADESILRMEQLLTANGDQGAVRQIEDLLSGESRETLLAGVGSLRALLASMAQAFCLEPHALDLQRVLDAELSALWVLFENCRPARMKGYGQGFSEEAHRALERNVETVLAQISEIAQAIGIVPSGESIRAAEEGSLRRFEELAETVGHLLSVEWVERTASIRNHLHLVWAEIESLAARQDQV